MAINLKKGQRIDLRKTSGTLLRNFCVGANWGAIELHVEEGGIFGFGKRKSSKMIKVDLDLSCILVNNTNEMCDHIYSPQYKPELLQKFSLPKGKLTTIDGALKHSGDDVEGDKEGDDNLDNEIITVDLGKINSNVSKIFFFLNNVGKEDFSQIPYAKIRMYEGTSTHVNEVFASYNLSAETQYSNKKALIMGKLVKNENEWNFTAIGDATDDTFLGQTIKRILTSYL